MKKILFVLALIPSLSFAATNYVYYSSADGSIHQAGKSYIYDARKDVLELKGVEIMGQTQSLFMSGIDWNVMRLGQTTSAVDSKTKKISELTIEKNVLPLTEAGKQDFEQVFNDKEKAIIKGILKVFNEKLPAQYNVSETELKAAISEMLK